MESFVKIEQIIPISITANAFYRDIETGKETEWPIVCLALCDGFNDGRKVLPMVLHQDGYCRLCTHGNLIGYEYKDNKGELQKIKYKK